MLTRDDLYGVSIKTSVAGETCTFSPGVGECNLTTIIIGFTGTKDVILDSPVVNPFGFISIPDTNYLAVIGNQGIRSQQPFVFGFTNSVRSDSALDIQPGESAVYSVGVSPNPGIILEMKLTEMRAKFHSIQCKMINGNSTQKILSDLVGELIDFLSFYNSSILTIYNTHTHISATPGNPTAVPVPLLVSYTASFPLTTDQTYLNNNQCFIDNTGTNL